MGPSVQEPPSQGKRGRSPDATTKVTPLPKKAMDKTPPPQQTNNVSRTYKDVVNDSLTHYIVGEKEALTANQVEGVFDIIIRELEKFIGTGIMAQASTTTASVSQS